MVRRHLLPPGKFETFQPINTTVIITNNNQQQNNTNYQQQKQSDMARIIPKSLTINQNHQNESSTASSLATIHLGKNLKCPVKTVLLHGDLNEALASEMMPPPPPPAPLPPPLYRYPSPLPQIPLSAPPTTLPSFKTIMTNAANNILMPHHDTGSGEVEFYKTETEMDNLNKKRHGSGSVSSGGSANQDDFEDEEGPINRIIGRATSFYKFFRLRQPCLGILY